MFKGENYDFRSVKTILRAKDLWEVVENNSKVEATFSQVPSGTPPKQETSSKEEIIKDQCVMHILQNGLTNTPFFKE